MKNLVSVFVAQKTVANNSVKKRFANISVSSYSQKANMYPSEGSAPFRLTWTKLLLTCLTRHDVTHDITLTLTLILTPTPTPTPTLGLGEMGLGELGLGKIELGEMGRHPIRDNQIHQLLVNLIKSAVSCSSHSTT